MASKVDARLMKSTIFPPEFNQKVDMEKVNLPVMKKWIAKRLSEILGQEDDVLNELCYNLIEANRYPEIKSVQIQLTGFLDKDAGTFCQELWNLLLSGQNSPKGVPKELLEAKKLELMQEKKDADRRGREAQVSNEQERRDSRQFGDSWYGRGRRGDRTFDNRDRGGQGRAGQRSPSPAPRGRGSRESYGGDSYVPQPRRRRESFSRRRDDRSPSVEESSRSRSRSRSEHRRNSRSYSPLRRRYSRSPTPPRRRYSRSPTPPRRRYSRSPTPPGRRYSRSPTPLGRRYSRSPTPPGRRYSRSPASPRGRMSPGQSQYSRKRPWSPYSGSRYVRRGYDDRDYYPEHDRSRSVSSERSPVAKRRRSRSRSFSPDRRRHHYSSPRPHNGKDYRSRSRSRSSDRYSISRNRRGESPDEGRRYRRSISPDDDYERGRGPGRAGETQPYRRGREDSACRERNGSSESSPSPIRGRSADSLEDQSRAASPRSIESSKKGDEEAKKALRKEHLLKEKILRENILKMRPSNQSGASVGGQG